MSGFNKLSVLIVGCGNIAGDLDTNNLDLDQASLTHAGAYTANQNFIIKACVDISQDKSDNFASHWDIPNAYKSIDQAIQAGVDYDVISICTPTDCHYENLIACLFLSPRLVFCEKPVTSSVKDTLKIKAAYEQAGVLLVINYSRRWDERVLSLRKEIETGGRGSLRSVVAYYNKGILNNGSHLLDLLGFLVGKMIIKNVGHADYDFFKDDPSVCVTLETGLNIPVILVPGAKACEYSIFEMQMVFDNSMLIMLDGGLRWVERRAGESDVFDGYRVLDAGIVSQGGYLGTMSNAVANIWGALARGESLNSTIDTALISHKLCEKILKACKR